MPASSEPRPTEPRPTEPQQTGARQEPLAVERLVVLRKHLHARPAGQVAQAAARRSETLIELVAGERRANARSILAVLALGAVAGSTVRVTVSGVAAVDVEDAAAEVVEILETPETE
jgi:phosphocarrier protein HPr